MKQKANKVILGLWMLAAISFVVHLSTNVGERWFWKIGSTENYTASAASSKTEAPSTLPADFTSWDVASETVQVHPLPSYILMHEVELSAVALILLAVIDRQSYIVTESLRYSRLAIPLLVGAVFIAPLLWVPCVWDVYADYRWLWQVGPTHIQITTVLVEETVIGICVGVLAFTWKFRSLLISRSGTSGRAFK